MVKTIYTCDVCGKEGLGRDIQKIRPSLGYPSADEIDICPDCLKEIDRAIKQEISRLRTENKINIDDL